MNDELWLKIIDGLPQIITSVGTVITAIGVIIVGRWAYKSKTQTESNAETLTANTRTLATVATKVDGMSSDLVAATKAAAGAEGRLKERGAERDHVAATSQEPKSVVPINGEDDPLKVKLVKDKGKT